jgi:hypothetical protein
MRVDEGTLEELADLMDSSGMKVFGVRAEGKHVRVGDFLGNSYHPKEYLREAGYDAGEDMELDGTLVFEIQSYDINDALGYLHTEFAGFSGEGSVILVGGLGWGEAPDFGIPEEGARLIRGAQVVAIIGPTRSKGH